MHPDALTALAEITHTVALLEQAPEGCRVDDGSDADVGEAIVHLDDLTARLGALRAAAEESMVARMEADTFQTPSGRTLKRAWRPGRVEWDRDAVDRAVNGRIADKVAFSVDTGQVIPAYRHVALEAITLMRATYGSMTPLTGRTAGMRQLELDPDEFRSTGTGRNVIESTVPRERR